MISKSVEETAQITEGLAKKLIAGSGATILALSGDLGSGKTTFAKAFAAAFGVDSNNVTSPTFVIMKSYNIAANGLAQTIGFKKLIHIDAYRLENPGQVAQIGWEKLAADPENLILVEWPEKMGEMMSLGVRKISFRFIDESTREILV